jgi:mannose-6-phosphate isomerase class I
VALGNAGRHHLVPAGAIHAIGGGLVIAEIQQRSDATFRLYDHGRQRELHIEDAIAVADVGPAKFKGLANQAYGRADAPDLGPALHIRKN